MRLAPARVADPPCAGPSGPSTSRRGPRPRPSRELWSWTSFGRRLHGLEDVPVAGTAADVPLEALLDLVFGRVRVLPEQCGRALQHPRGAEPALQCVIR